MTSLDTTATLPYLNTPGDQHDTPPPALDTSQSGAAAAGHGQPTGSTTGDDVPMPLSPNTAGKSFLNLYVQGLHPSVTDATLRQWFEPFGAIKSAKVMLNVRTGQSRGFGFVLFNEELHGRSAFRALHGKTFKSPPADSADPSDPVPESTLVIEASTHDGDRASVESQVMYLRNIPAAIPQLDVLAQCQKHGVIMSFLMAPILPRHGAARRKQRQATVAGSGADGSHVDPEPQSVGSPTTTTAAGSDLSLLASPQSSTAGHPSGEPGTSSPGASLFLATVEFKTVDMARDAINFFHKSRPWAECQLPLLAKFADTAELKEYRMQHRKARQTLLAQKQKGDHATPLESPSRPAGGAVAKSPASTHTTADSSRQQTLGGSSLPSPPLAMGMSSPSNLGVLRDKGAAVSSTSAARTSTGPAQSDSSIPRRSAARGADLPSSNPAPPGNFAAPSAMSPTVASPTVPLPAAAAPQPSAAIGAGIPIPASQTVYYRGTLVSCGDGTFRMGAPELIQFMPQLQQQQQPPSVVSPQHHQQQQPLPAPMTAAAVQQQPVMAAGVAPTAVVMPFPATPLLSTGGAPPSRAAAFPHQQQPQQHQQHGAFGALPQQQPQLENGGGDSGGGGTSSTPQPQQPQQAAAPMPSIFGASFLAGGTSVGANQPSLVPVAIGQSVGGTHHQMLVLDQHSASTMDPALAPQSVTNDSMMMSGGSWLETMRASAAAAAAQSAAAAASNTTTTAVPVAPGDPSHAASSAVASVLDPESPGNLLET